MELLENNLYESELECSRYKEIIAILEEKVKQAEESLFNICSKNKTSENSKLEEIRFLKGVNKNHSDEIQRNKSEINLANRSVKAKEKEKHNFESKIENQSETIKSL